MNIITNKWAYYNEIDPKAAAWIRELIKAKLITDGEVDERSIVDVQAGDVRNFRRCHWFAGVAGWDYALRLAGVGDDYPLWTASLPCQPFSVAGLGKGKDDERHLLPHFLELVRQCKPDRIFGEQVEGAIRHGWLDDLQATMEAEGYAVGHCVLGAHSVGSFHQRQRLYWVANANNKRRRRESFRSGDIGAGAWAESGRRGGVDDRMADCQSKRFNGGESAAEQTGWGIVETGGGTGDTRITASERDPGSVLGTETEVCGENGSVNGDSGVRFADAGEDDRSVDDTKGQRRSVRNTKHIGQADGEINASANPSSSTYQQSPEVQTSASGEWDSPDWLYCRDNKYRPIKPGLKPLVDGIPRGMVRGGGDGEPVNPNETQEARVMRLKGYGNAIVPQVAAEFIRAFMEVSQ